MPLTAGTRLGPYEVLSPLGAGGMGEVYRARDTKLGREVAIKVLPESVSADPERLARFEREARALASLNHPNIVTVYSVEEAGGVRLLAMELIEGHTLDSAIPTGGLPLPRFFEIALPLADALSAAHERGIVHRDLKPGNVMLSREGRLKVLDFGLAKLVASDSDPNVTDLPTESRVQLTSEGTVFGTVAYMSPEQARGGKLDARSDVFSLGVLFYEMLTGERPFKGTSAVDIMSSILRDWPSPVTEVRADLPPLVGRVLRRCLAKDPHDRYQTSRDVFTELRELQVETSTVPPKPAGPSAIVPGKTGAVRSEDGLSIAVIAFKRSGDAETEAFADGLAEEIGTGLSRFRYLSLVANAAAARYRLEGSIRKGGSAVRVSAQLSDAKTGTQLWAETYNRDLQGSDLFTVQDDIAARIVATVADSYGVLVHSIRAAMRQKDDADLSPLEWQFQYFAYREQITPSSHAALAGRLESALKRDERQSELWACLAQIHVDQYAFGFGGDAGSLDRALTGARRAVELDRANQFALVSLAQVHFFRRDLAAFAPAAERAMALNPLNTDAVGILGLLIVHTGEFQRGAAIVRRAMELNANHAGWMHFAPLWEHFQKGEYEGALERANRVDVPGLFWPYLVMASACGHLGRRAEAAAAVRDLLAIDPDFAAHARANILSWHFASGLLEPMLEGLRKAGLAIPRAEGSSGASKRTATVTAASGPVSTDEGFWVAVLPFRYGGANADLTALADGLSDEIVTGLSRFSYLRVAGKASGARYVIEGSLRHAGTKLRLAVQLVDTASGAHLWAETYERTFSAEAIFALQDDLVPRIVSTVADQNGVLIRRFGETLRGKSEDALTPYEAVLRAFSFFERVTPEEHAVVRRILERATREAPDHADGWSMLSLIYAVEYADDFNLLPDPLERALAAAQRAVSLAATSALGHYAMAFTLFLRKETASFRAAAEKAVTLNPMDGSILGLIGVLLACAGELDRGCEMADAAMRLNPSHSGLFHWSPFVKAYFGGRYAEALQVAVRMNMPNYFYAHAARAAALGQLGQREAAAKELRELLALRPDFATAARREFAKWYGAEWVELMLEGLRKAGLDVPFEKPSTQVPVSGATRADDGFWVAVLPFKHSGADLAALAGGLTEDIVTGLSRFSYLRVRSAGQELGARYVMEGSLRQTGTRLRLAVQLVDKASGAHLWSENYERAFDSGAVFELQDDLVARVVSTCGDRFGVLARSISEAVRGREPGALGPYEALMRAFGYHLRLTEGEHAEARGALERAVEAAPSNPDCWAMLSWVTSHEFAHGFNARPGSLDRALASARRAVDLAPSNPLAQQALAVVSFFRKETAACVSAAERALALNPLDTSNEAMFLLFFTGDWERGSALIRRAMDLNPHHPRWYELTLVFDQYRQGRYRAAVEGVAKANAPEVFWGNLMLAAAHAQLGELPAARTALRDLLAQKPGFAGSAPALLGKWFDPQMVALLMEGLRKAGLETPSSGAVRADEGFWVAVLPFKYGGDVAELTALAEGLTEDIVTGLSRFSYLRVCSAGKEQGGRYVMEGSLRQAGTKLRVAAQLVDTSTGAHLWAESYERAFSPEAVFELQDDLVPRIVATVADINGVLVRSMSDAVRSRAPEELSPYEAVLRSFGYFPRVSAEELDPARSGLEQAIRRAPAYADAWAMLALLCVQDYAQGFELRADALASGLAAAQRAVETGTSNHLASFSLAQALYFHKELASFRNAAERAVTLNPMDGNSLAFIGELLTYSGDRERGLKLATRAKQLNPHHPGWYWYADFYDAYQRGDYRGALDLALKVNLPGHWFMHAAMAACHGQLGERQAAAKALRELLRLRPGFTATFRADVEKWWGPEYVASLIDGWKAAGLEMAAPAPSAAPRPAAADAVAIAVLPFSDLSPAKDQEYLCEGMAEEIMNALVGAGGIRVASRTSAFRARQEGPDLPAIARALGVNHVLEGSVRTSGSRLRVTAQLTDVATGFQLWSERFDREAADVFAVQDEIAAGVVDAIKARLAPGTHTVPSRPQIRNLEAYRSYLKGRHLRGIEDHAGALKAFEDAVRLDPSHAPSWTGLGEINVLAAQFAMLPARQACATARKALSVAAGLQGESAEGLHVEAFAAFIERRWQEMETAWRRAIELEPTHVLALGSFGIVLCTRGRLDEALLLFARAREADPLASFPYMITGAGLLEAGKPQESLRHFEDALSFQKEDASALFLSGMALVALGRYDEGIAAAEHAAAVAHRSPYFLGILGWALATAGRKDEARKILDEMRAGPSGAPANVPEAMLLGALGELDAAFEVVDRAEDEYQASLYYTGWPGFDPFRGDPRFTALLKRLGLQASVPPAA